MIAVVLNSSKEELKEKASIEVNGSSYINTRYLINIAAVIVFAVLLLYFFRQAIDVLQPFGEHTLRMANAYVEGADKTGSANLVTGILFDFRGYDTLGEATILFTAVIGILTILRIKGKK